MTNVVNVYACGGCGISIASKLDRQDDCKEKASLNIYYFDTSRSDLTPTIDSNNVFIAGEHSDSSSAAKGSGKVRARNNDVIKPLIPKILHSYKPSEALNIIISSASGGSGAVYASHLLTKLLAQKSPTIVIVVSSIGSLIEVQNSIKTLMSFQRTAASLDVPVIANHWQNDKETPEKTVDDGILALIDRLRVLYSGNNRKLDQEDLRNLLQYGTVTSRESKLVYLDIYDEHRMPPSDVDVVTVASLANEGMEVEFPMEVEYQAIGYLPQDTQVKLREAIHFCVVEGHAVNAVRQLQELATRYEASIRNRKRDESIFTQQYGDDDDIVL